MHKPFSTLGRLRRKFSWQARDKRRSQPQRVDELALCGTGVYADTGESDRKLDCAEGFVFDLAHRRAIKRVREVGFEAREIEVVGTASDLLVDREPDPRRRPSKLGVRDEIGDRGHVVGSPRLVVGS